MKQANDHLSRLRSAPGRIWQVRRAIVFYVVLLAMGMVIGAVLRDLTHTEIQTIRPPTNSGLVITALVAFVILAAIPFVPGAEIGFALLIVFGGAVAPVVYFGMVGALCLSFLVARFAPRGPLCRSLRWLGLGRAADLVERLGSAPAADRVRILQAGLPPGLARKFVNHRFVLLAVAINIPGNSVLGGGGGLAFASGLSGIYPFWRFVLTVAVAVLPAPLAFFVLS